MAERKEIEIAGKKFRTQKEAEDFTRGFLQSLITKKSVRPQEEAWIFLSELIKRHSDYDEKLGPGISEFLIGHSRYKHIQLDLKHIDGYIMDISWLKCISGKQTPVISNLKAAMRVAIESQINEYRALNISKITVCGLCNSSISKEDLIHIDHVVPFETLFKEFLSGNPNHPQKFDDEKKTNRAKFHQEDQEFEEEWFQFHKNLAELRIVHKTCNLQRTRS